MSRPEDAWDVLEGEFRVAPESFDVAVDSGPPVKAPTFEEEFALLCEKHGVTAFAYAVVAGKDEWMDSQFADRGEAAKLNLGIDMLKASLVEWACKPQEISTQVT